MLKARGALCFNKTRESTTESGSARSFCLLKGSYFSLLFVKGLKMTFVVNRCYTNKDRLID